MRILASRPITAAAWVICHGTPILPRAEVVVIIFKVPPYFGCGVVGVAVAVVVGIVVVVGDVVEELSQPTIPKIKMPINKKVIYTTGFLFRIVPSNFYFK